MTTDKKLTLNPIVVIYIGLVFWGIVFIALSFSSTIKFLTNRVDFTIVSSSMLCEKPLNNRCVRHFNVKIPDGRFEDFVPNDYEFPEKQLVNGTSLQKQKYSFHYRVNGKDTMWMFGSANMMRFLFGFISALIGIGLFTGHISNISNKLKIRLNNDSQS